FVGRRPEPGHELIRDTAAQEPSHRSKHLVEVLVQLIIDQLPVELTVRPLEVAVERHRQHQDDLPHRDQIVSPLASADGGDPRIVHIRVSQRPITLPSVSLKYANAPMFGMGVRGVIVLPPPASTFFRESSIESTPMVITGTGVSDVRSIRPPLIAPDSFGRIFSSTATVPAVV